MLYKFLFCEIVLAISRIAFGRASARAAEERTHIKAIKDATASVGNTSALCPTTVGCSCIDSVVSTSGVCGTTVGTFRIGDGMAVIAKIGVGDGRGEGVAVGGTSAMNGILITPRSLAQFP